MRNGVSENFNLESVSYRLRILGSVARDNKFRCARQDFIKAEGAIGFCMGPEGNFQIVDLLLQLYRCFCYRQAVLGKPAREGSGAPWSRKIQRERGAGGKFNLPLYS